MTVHTVLVIIHKVFIKIDQSVLAVSRETGLSESDDHVFPLRRINEDAGEAA